MHTTSYIFQISLFFIKYTPVSYLPGEGALLVLNKVSSTTQVAHKHKTFRLKQNREMKYPRHVLGK